MKHWIAFFLVLGLVDPVLAQAIQPKGFLTDWRVTRITDGDTISVALGSKKERIRFACIDAPERKQPWGSTATDYLKRILTVGDTVKLNITDTDRYGRRVAEVWKDGKLVQLQQVEAGTVYVFDQYLYNCPNQKAIVAAERIAEQKRSGVWSDPSAEKPWDYRAAHR